MAKLPAGLTPLHKNLAAGMDLSAATAKAGAKQPPVEKPSTKTNPR